MIVLARIDYRYLRKVSLVMAVGALVLLVFVMIPKIGVSANGASRWIQIGPFFEIHPAEIAKLALVVYLSHWLATRGTPDQELLPRHRAVLDHSSCRSSS